MDSILEDYKELIKNRDAQLTNTVTQLNEAWELIHVAIDALEYYSDGEDWATAWEALAVINRSISTKDTV